MQVTGQAQLPALPQHLQSRKETMEKDRLDPIRHQMDQLRTQLNEQRLAMDAANSCFFEKENKFNSLSNKIVKHEGKIKATEKESEQFLKQIEAIIDTMTLEDAIVSDDSFRQIDELHLKNDAVLKKIELIQLKQGINYENIIKLKNQQNSAQVQSKEAKHQCEYIEYLLEEKRMHLEFEQTQINSKIQYKIEKQRILNGSGV